MYPRVGLSQVAEHNCTQLFTNSVNLPLLLTLFHQPSSGQIELSVVNGKPELVSKLSEILIGFRIEWRLTDYEQGFGLQSARPVRIFEQLSNGFTNACARRGRDFDLVIGVAPIGVYDNIKPDTRRVSELGPDQLGATLASKILV